MSIFLKKLLFVFDDIYQLNSHQNQNIKYESYIANENEEFEEMMSNNNNNTLELKYLLEVFREQETLRMEELFEDALHLL
jgi:hypothetical protein